LADSDVPDEVLARARAGDEAAREAIYRTLAPATLTLIRRMVGERALAEDIFQDTMMTLYERLPQFRREAPLGAWLRQIALTDGSVASTLVVSGCRGDSIDVERALAALPPTARAVVWMFEVEGYSHEEIAHAFGRSVSFSKSQLARAHVRLRAWFEPQEIKPSCTMI